MDDAGIDRWCDGPLRTRRRAAPIAGAPGSAGTPVALARQVSAGQVVVGRARSTRGVTGAGAGSAGVVGADLWR